MKLKDLRKLVDETQNLPEDTEILVSRDEEGDSYIPLGDISTGIIEPWTQTEDEIVVYELMNNETPNCIVLFPGRKTHNDTR